MTDHRTYTVGHLFAGCGGGGDGFHRSRFGWRGIRGRFRTVFGIDSDGPALRSFERLTAGPGVKLDLFSEDDYRAFHGEAPPRGWREVEAADLRALSPEAPDVLFTSPPCVGMSRLISAKQAAAERYRAVNRLTARGVSLVLSAWDRPPRVILLENVPGMASRGRHLLEQIEADLTFHGYSVGYVTHDLGDLGGLGARRPRFMLVARHEASVPPHLFQPEPRGKISVGEALGELPLPGDPLGGPMHRLGHYQWITWLRLALVPAGKDWRALKDLRVADGVLQDFALVPTSSWHAGALGVTPWTATSATLTTRSVPTTGRHSVADPRILERGDYSSLGVVPWDQTMGTITAMGQPGSGAFSIEDPRARCWSASRTYANTYRVAGWESSCGTVTGSTRPGSGASSIADPRLGGVRHNNVFRVVRWAEDSPAITTGATPTSGGLAVADPRSPWMRQAWAGAYGVVPWDEAAGVQMARGRVDNAPMAVADPRGVPKPTERGVYVILSEDGTWHRPITRLEAATLQGFRPEDMGLQVEGGRLVLEGTSTTAWQKWIGNAVPPPAAEAIAEVVGRCLLQADAGETFVLSSTPHWARPLAVALSCRS